MTAAKMQAERKGFNSWVDAHEHIKFTKIALRRWKLSSVVAALRTWRQLLRTRAAMHRSLLHLSRQQSAKAWRSWMVLYAQRRLMRRAAAAFCNHFVFKAFNGWLASAKARHARLTRLRAGLVSLTHTNVRKAWNSWIGAVLALVPLKRGMAHWRNRPASRAFGKLQVVAAKRRQLRARLFRLVNRKLTKAFGSWRAKFVTKYDRKLWRLGAAMVQPRKRRALNQWLFHVRGKARLRGLVNSFKGARRGESCFGPRTHLSLLGSLPCEEI